MSAPTPVPWCEADDCPVSVCAGPHVAHTCTDGATVTRHAQDTTPCPLCGTPAGGGPSDREIVEVAAEHMMNLLQALVSSGLDARRVVRLCSTALVELDTLATAAAQVDRRVSPIHDLATVSIDRLSDALAGMRVRTPARMEGFTLAETYGQMLTSIREAVEHHWQMSSHGGSPPPPKLIIPGRNGL